MEQERPLPEPVVLRQDDRTDIHIQPVIQSGRRQVDVRVWRRAARGMVPVRNGISIASRDLDAVHGSLDRLAEAGQRQRRVTRFVTDLGEGRRLRAEIEPFGTHFSARLGFWQRVRSSWRSVDDGLVVLCDQLPAIKATLQRFTPWLSRPDLLATRRQLPPTLDTWPAPAADWMTVEIDRVALHPRGLHITAAREGEAVAVRQWRRAENIWLPEPVSFLLSLPDLETALHVLSSLADDALLPLEHSTLRLHHEGETVTVEETADGTNFELRLSFPAPTLPHFGRLLAEAWRILAPHLTPEELPSPDEPAPAVEVVEEPTEPVAEPMPEDVVTPLGEVRLGERTFILARRDSDGEPSFGLTWQDGWLDLPLAIENDVIAPLRSLYYETLRGRRGQTQAISASPALRASVHNRGLQPFLVVEQERPDHVTALTLPVGEMPAFLDAIQDILARSGEEAPCAPGY